jgi:hypothetical protein
MEPKGASGECREALARSCHCSITGHSSMLNGFQFVLWLALEHFVAQAQKHHPRQLEARTIKRHISLLISSSCPLHLPPPRPDFLPLLARHECDESLTRPDGECQKEELDMNKNSDGTCNDASVVKYGLWWFMDKLAILRIRFGQFTEGLVPLSHHPLRNQRCFAHNPLRGSTTQRKLTAPGSPKRLQRQHTHKRHAIPAPAHTPAHSDLLRTASAPTSTHSNGFCVIWVCISSSSSFFCVPPRRGRVF